MDIEEEERIEAVNKYIREDKPSNICGDAGRSEKWLFKWVNRFKTGEEEWYRSMSRAPKKNGRKTGREIESTVVNIRIALMEGNEHESKYLGVSADAIQYRMETLGISREEIPSVSTIKRIVKKHGLIVNKRERYPRRFCRFLRFCLYVGVEVVFINPKCPWMNGSIENFNGWFEAKFWDKERIKISR